MSTSTPPITTTDEFQRQLRALVIEARRNDVPIEGSWSSQDPTDSWQYEALITEVIQRPD